MTRKPRVENAGAVSEQLVAIKTDPLSEAWKSEATVRAACGGSPWINEMAEEKDPRWRARLRVEGQGEEKVDVAWDLSCRDGGSVLQIIKRIEARCQKYEEWKRKPEKYSQRLLRVGD